MRMAVARADAATLLTRAMRASAAPHGVTIDTCAVIDRPWASATFEGVRHELRMTLAGIAARSWLSLLPDAELGMRGHIVADIVVDSAEQRGGTIDVVLTALTIAER